MTKRLNIYLPEYIAEKLSEEAHKEGMSMSGVVVGSLMLALGISQEELDEARGYHLPARFADRKKKV